VKRLLQQDRMLFTSESVTEGHPDKVADQISDAILDEILAKDPLARVACETMVTTGLVLVAGEITTDCYVDMQRIIRDTICDIGYTRAKYGFDGETCGVIVSLDEQSPDIAIGVDRSSEAKEVAADSASASADESLGAGDQGMMFGFACTETEDLMPLPISLAQRLAQRLAAVRKSGEVPYLRPDGKTQVTIEYRNGRPARADAIVISAQHSSKADLAQIKADILAKVIEPIVPAELLDANTKYYVNPTGRFVMGGPQADTGLTGRKIIVDTYGGYGRHGGGCFSGKDATKVDRSASYAARYVAKNIVAAGLASHCEIQLAYAIGVAQPVSVSIDTFGTAVVEEDRIAQLVLDTFDLTPSGIINQLDLRRPIYRQIAAYGHFGRADLDLPWEQTDKAEDLRRLAGIG